MNDIKKKAGHIASMIYTKYFDVDNTRKWDLEEFIGELEYNSSLLFLHYNDNHAYFTTMIM